ncbi:hypothetical protein NPIL_461 [Nephila pilipes]|uniref:Uncharacterized protein n=1 Tax=Nephila pilipes TaxID=299642 RepID=A0A8X6R070_NEPPI|nr:hypothetical protein NPIL_461 [Nephila pilipes]
MKEKTEVMDIQKNNSHRRVEIPEFIQPVVPLRLEPIHPNISKQSTLQHPNENWTIAVSISPRKNFKEIVFPSRVPVAFSKERLNL